MTVIRPSDYLRPESGIRWLVSPNANSAERQATPRIGFKPSARVKNLSPQITQIYPHIESSWREHNGPTPVVTSGNDRKHKAGSKHYSNEAIDLRCNNLSDAQCEAIAQSLQSRIGPDYYVDFEKFPKNPSNDHIHVEHDPKPRLKKPLSARPTLGDGLNISDWMRLRNMGSDTR
jgi:hypothetical protein